jgi:phytoene dehydrogenase-like protein
MVTSPEPRKGSIERARAHAAVPDRVDVAVIGCGLGGLTAALHLAQQGLRVACFDGHYVAGGCATQFSRGPKSARYHFDIGLHYIGDCGPDGEIPRILREYGIVIDYAPLDPDGFDTLVFPDFRFRVPASVDLYRERLIDLFPREKRGIDKYVRALRAVMRSSRKFDRRDGRIGVIGALAFLRDALELRRIGDHTIGELLDDFTRDVRLRAVLLGQSGDYGLAPSRVSAFLHLGLAAHYFRGAYYPKGGGQVIADRIAEAVERAGGTIHLRHRVARILVERGRAIGIRLAPRAGEPAREVRANVVLSNADLRRTLLELVGPEHLPSEWKRRAERFEMAAALFMTFLGVRGDLRARGMVNTNYWQFDEYDMERIYRLADDLEVRACYITSATLKDPEHARHHAPEGISNVEVMALVGGTGDKWGVSDASADAWTYDDIPRYRDTKKRIEDELVARFQRLFPGDPNDIVFCESATPITHRRFTGATGGTGYGLAATPEQFLQKRPGYRGPIDGLYLCGASTRAGHGIVGAIMGGRRAAMRILRAAKS